MFERLTDRTGSGQVYLIEGPEEDMYGYYTGKGLKQIENVIDRLAAYEDSGMSPEQVQEFAKAKAEGRLVVLPCKVGRTFTAYIDAHSGEMDGSRKDKLKWRKDYE